MHLGIKNIIGGAKKFLFGDGSYSYNIIVDKTSEIPVSGGFTNSNFNAHGQCTYANLMNGVLQEPYGCDTPSDTGPFSLDINFSSATALTKIRFYNWANTERLKDFRVWAYISGAWQKVALTAVSEGGIIRATDEGQVSNANGWVAAEFEVTIATSFRLEFLNTWGIGDANAYLTEVKVYGPVQPQASYSAALGNIAATGTFSITGTQWNGGAYPATNIFNGVLNDWGILDAVANSCFNWDFGRAVEMQKVRILLYGGAANAHNIVAEYSDNGTAWSVGYNVGYVPQDTVFHDYPLTTAGAHRYWRLRNTAAVIFELSEVQWIEQVTVQNCIVVTGAATVAPDPDTGASVFSCQNLVIDGGTLAPTTNCKGLIGIVSGSVRCINGGRIHIDRLGKAGNFGNLTVLDLVPQRIKRKLRGWDSFVLVGEGSAGGAGRSVGNISGPGGTGSAATLSLQSGGGGGGGGGDNSGGWAPGANGGKGGPCCGGAGGGAGGQPGAAGTTGDYGGPGGSAGSNASYGSGGGAGDPVGTSQGPAASAPIGAGGGLLLLATPAVSIASGCVCSADGGTGGNVTPPGAGGGGAGGGVVLIVTNSGGYSNAGTVRASGGAGGTCPGYSPGGAGGAGSVNTFTV